jgi:hypothetical protein
LTIRLEDQAILVVPVDQEWMALKEYDTEVNFSSHGKHDITVNYKLNSTTKNTGI